MNNKDEVMFIEDIKIRLEVDRGDVNRVDGFP